MSMSYVGKRPCGCCEMATVDSPEHAKDVARDVATALRRGLTVERVTVEWVRTESVWGCEVCKPAKPKQKEFTA